MLRLGVHCSVRKGLVTALEEADRLGCTTLQIFTRSPRLWRAGAIQPQAIEAFHHRRQQLHLNPLIIHTPYLPNLSTRDEKLYARSYRALIEDLENCEKLEADFLVIHPGAYSEGATPDEGIQRMGDAINRAFAYVPGKTMLLLENMAGGGRRLGSSFEELAQMLKGTTDEARIGICLDTAHTLGAGYAFSTAQEVAATLGEFDRLIGLKRLRVIHANDSRAARGTHRDLHTHLGQGEIGLKAFRALFSDPRLHHPAVILETPKDTPAADPMNLKTARSLMENETGGLTE